MSTEIGSRYLAGFNIATMNSTEEWGDDPNDCVIKRLFVKAIKNEVNDWELIACIEVEIEEEIFDVGFEVYRVPFPFDINLRKAIIRSFIAFPKYFEA